MEGYSIFIDKIFKKTGIDLASYKERQMKRRIESLITRNNFKSFDNYFDALCTNKSLYEEFINYLTINVSEFYRNPQQWEVLEKEIIPNLLKNKKRIKIWSAACSTGEEPYSLTMLLTRFFPLNEISILATDIDLGAIEKAKAGIYSPKSIENLPKDFVTNYFDNINGKYHIKDIIKKQITFQKHNLLEDNYPSGCDLIVCRNVMIYFTEETKAKMYLKFHDALDDQGILFVGSTEQIILPQRYNLMPAKTFFYKKAK